MPKRPPKKWFYSTLKAIKRMKNIDNPQALVGWIWYHYMKPKTKKKILSAAELKAAIKTYRLKGDCTPMGKAKRRKIKKRKKIKSIVLKVKQPKKKMRVVKAVSHEPLIIKEGVSMEGKKKRSKKRRYGFEGLAGKKRSRRRHYLGNPAGAALDSVKTAVIVGAGAVAGSFIGKLVPIKDTRIKAATPLIAGVVLPMVIKNKMVDQLALGMAAIGVVSLVKSFAPNLNLLGVEGDDLYTVPMTALPATMGLPVEGEPDAEGEAISIDDMAGIPLEGDFRSPAQVM